MGELGLLGACVPAEYGGAGADFVSYVLALEEISRGDAGLGVTFAVHVSAGQLPILAHGSDRADRPPDPAARAGIRAVRVRADGVGQRQRRLRHAHPCRCTDPAHPRITGTKQWITNGSHAHTFNVFAREGDRISAYVVRRGAAGFSVTREEEKLGQNSSSTADLAFDGTPSERLGPAGAGMRIALSTLDGGRIGIAAQAVGIAQAALDVAAPMRRSARVRQADRRLPGDRPQARRHADRDRGARALRSAPRASRTPAARTPSRARRRSSSPAASRATGPARRSRSSAATATPRSFRPSATTATPRSRRSTRARARSSDS